MILEAIVVGPLGVNCYLAAAGPGRQAFIIDPGDDEEKITAALERHKLVPGLVVNTHGHYDHIGCDDCFGVDVCAHKDDVPLLKDPELNLSVLLGDFYRVRSRIRALTDGQELELDGMLLRVIHTPGHSPGSICLEVRRPEEKALFTGDTLFHGAVGRTDFEGGSEESLISSIKEKLLVFPPDTVIYPGHGPFSRIERERRGNPFID